MASHRRSGSTTAAHKAKRQRYRLGSGSEKNQALRKAARIEKDKKFKAKKHERQRTTQ